MMILILSSLFACADSEPVECEGLDEQACEDAEHCFATDGRPVHGDYDCENVGSKEFAGCRTPQAPAPEPCADVGMYFYPPGAPDECWFFGDDCTPDGWKECDTHC